ncbi:MAG: hypothetical protein HUU45_15665 [Leptospiraceae bacterium]|nr:hypothetical protein [Leptospiraceae bacterium]
MFRVKRWIKQGDMIKRWAGAAFLHQEQKFRRVKGYATIDDFLKVFVRTEKYIDEKEIMQHAV